MTLHVERELYAKAVTEAAQWLRVHPETLKRAARRGAVPVIRISRQELRFEPGDCSRRTPPGQPPTPTEMILIDSRGRRYHKDTAGVIRRLDPKPWRNKAERRRVLANRRADRAAALAAMED